MFEKDRIKEELFQLPAKRGKGSVRRPGSCQLGQKHVEIDTSQVEAEIAKNNEFLQQNSPKSNQHRRKYQESDFIREDWEEEER